MIFDASALLAMLLQEPGSETALSHLDGSSITTVNMTEALSRIASAGESRAMLESIVEKSGLDLVELTPEDAVTAALLRPLTRHLGLSLGDRVCLAVAKRLGVPALTADRAWDELPPDIGVETVLIR